MRKSHKIINFQYILHTIACEDKYSLLAAMHPSHIYKSCYLTLYADLSFLKF